MPFRVFSVIYQSGAIIWGLGNEKMAGTGDCSGPCKKKIVVVYPCCVLAKGPPETKKYNLAWLIGINCAWL